MSYDRGTEALKILCVHERYKSNFLIETGREHFVMTEGDVWYSTWQGLTTSLQDHLDPSELSDLMTDSTSSPMSNIDSNFQTPTASSSHTAVIIQRGARRLSGKQSPSSHQPHSVDSGIGSPRSIPLYSPTTPLTHKTSSSPSVSFSENSPEK